ncbi:MAG: hypothetical protein KDA38_15860 [Planctomycetales bacterium]|nr:hypothetical protein [Planctomycetales bacterium]
MPNTVEYKIQRMGNTGPKGGGYYTPQSLIRAMVQEVAPRIGQRSKS